MINIDAVKVFTQDPKMGALAGVVLDASPLAEHNMQMVAKVVNASETSFLFPSELADFRLRWFTPSNEVGICVHATIGAVAAWIKAHKSSKQRLSIETRNAILDVKIDGARIYINIPDYRIKPQEINQQLICRDFEFLQDELDGVPKIIKIYEDYELVVPLKSLSTLEQLKPSIEKYSGICNALGVTGLSLFTKETYSPLHDLHLREFAPLYGYLEDPLCGMASGCVFTYLRANNSEINNLRVEQGNFCGTNGTITVQIDQGPGVWIGGEYCFGSPIQVDSGT